MTRTLVVLSTLCFPIVAAAGTTDLAQPMDGDAVRVLFSADCGPCQADLAAAQALYDAGVPVLIETMDGIDGFAAARARKASPAPTVPMVTAPQAELSRYLVSESRAMTGSPPTLDEVKSSMPSPEASVAPVLQARMQAYDAALNALWQD